MLHLKVEGLNYYKIESKSKIWGPNCYLHSCLGINSRNEPIKICQIRKAPPIHPATRLDKLKWAVNSAQDRNHVRRFPPLYLLSYLSFGALTTFKLENPSHFYTTASKAIVDCDSQSFFYSLITPAVPIEQF